MVAEYQDRIAQYLRTLFNDQRNQQTTIDDNARTGTFPTQFNPLLTGTGNNGELVRVASVDPEHWIALVQPVILSYDGNSMVMAQNPTIPAYNAYIPANAPQMLTGDCAFSTFFGNVYINTLQSEPTHVVLPLSAPAIPTIIMTFAGFVGFRASTVASSPNITRYTDNPFLNTQIVTVVGTVNFHVHGPQCYWARAYPQGFDLRDVYQDITVIQLDIATRDRIPAGTRVLSHRGPMTRGTVYTTNASMTTITGSAGLVTGFYVEVPVWLG